MTLRDKIVDWLGLAISANVGISIGLAIYRGTMARAAEIAREEGLDPAVQSSAEEGVAGYEDGDGTLMDPEDAAALMSDDDLSMWDTQVEDGNYRDEDGGHGGDRAGRKKDDNQTDD